MANAYRRGGVYPQDVLLARRAYEELQLDRIEVAFRTLLSYARSKHVGWFSYWSLNRDRACDPSVPHNWAEGYCSSVSQAPYDFSKIVAQYTG